MNKISQIFSIVVLVILFILGLNYLMITFGNTLSNSPSTVNSTQKNKTLLWSSQLENPNWQESWGILDRGSWGWQNLQVISDPSRKFSRILRVTYPANSASPTVTRNHQAPVGGGQFYATLGMAPQDSLRLSYYVRFSDNFNFVKGGKLPGLFGGTVTSGRTIPDGTNGFSTRYMWRRQGDAEVYAYLPTSHKHGTSMGRGNWQFQPGKWYQLEQEVILNQPGKSNGQIRVWLNEKKVLDQGGLTIRTTNSLKIEGIFFSTFFGGGDASWATPQDVYVDFAEFSVN